MIFYILDLIGVAVFSVSGTLAAIQAKLDLLGVMVIAAITAIGGGTLRDVLLNRHPIFWIMDPKYLYVIIGSSLLTIFWVQWLPVPANALLVADALGLALFAMSGAQLAEKAAHRAMTVILMGTITGVGGGILRDVLTAKIPLILRQDIYATAAIGGIVMYLVLQRVGIMRPWAFGVGLVFIAGLRLSAVFWGLHLPTF